MFAKSIKYTDYNGDQREDTLYFNISKSEALKMEFSDGGRLSQKLLGITKADGRQIINLVEEVVLNGYGEKSEDGRYLIKNDEIRNRFSQSAAYDALFEELVMDANKFVDFVYKVLPEIPDDDIGKPIPIPEPANK